MDSPVWIWPQICHVPPHFTSKPLESSCPFLETPDVVICWMCLWERPQFPEGPFPSGPLSCQHQASPSELPRHICMHPSRIPAIITSIGGMLCYLQHPRCCTRGTGKRKEMGERGKGERVCEHSGKCHIGN